MRPGLPFSVFSLETINRDQNFMQLLFAIIAFLLIVNDQQPYAI